MKNTVNKQIQAAEQEKNAAENQFVQTLVSAIVAEGISIWVQQVHQKVSPITSGLNTTDKALEGKYKAPRSLSGLLPVFANSTCEEVLISNPSASSGFFYLYPKGNDDVKFRTHCLFDKTGAWTRVASKPLGMSSTSVPLPIMKPFQSDINKNDVTFENNKNLYFAGMDLKYWDYFGTSWEMLIQIPQPASSLIVTDSVTEVFTDVFGKNGKVQAQNETVYEMIFSNEKSLMTLSEFGAKLWEVRETVQLHPAEDSNQVIIPGTKLTRVSGTPSNVLLDPFNFNVKSLFFIRKV